MVPRPDPYDRRVAIVIDVGNSAVKVARATVAGIGEVTRLPTAGGPDPVALARLLAGDGGPVGLVSVVPAWTEAIRRAAGGRRLLVATHETVPLPVRLPSPSTVGSDRLLGAWAARELVGAPCVVIDVGTATTIDAVDAEGRFAGGAILPGPALAVRSLASGTALLPSVSLEPPDRAIGRDTVEAIGAGVMLGHREAVGGLVARMADELGASPGVVLTGGDAAVLGSPGWVTRTQPWLLLEGLGALVTRAPAGAAAGARG